MFLDKCVEIGLEVTVLDDLSAGFVKYIKQHVDTPNFRFIKGDILVKEDLDKALEDVDLVFHFAAQPDVRLSVSKPFYDFKINVEGSLLLIEKMREKKITKLVFASSGGTIYGHTDKIPTPETEAEKPE